MIVLDSSAAIWSLEPGNTGDRVRAQLAATDTIHAPELMVVECANVLRRRVLSGAVTFSTAREGMERIEDTGVTLHPHRPLIPVIFDLAGNMTAYDAAYVALAMAIDAPLLTSDARLARAAERWCDVTLL